MFSLSSCTFFFKTNYFFVVVTFKILFLVGSGRLKLNPEDSREDTPQDLKDLIISCSQYDRNKRYDFVEINEILKKTRLIKTKSNKLQRAQSVPNVSFNQDRSQGLGLSIYDDEFYPSTPHADLLSKLNSPLQFPSDFSNSKLNDETFEYNNNNNRNSYKNNQKNKEWNPSQGDADEDSQRDYTSQL